ncbi:MAG: phosphodiester glycosidase family protein [Phycisphaerae bacterium]|nr:phosphodiester glycosidase family protein [Phycisphaerae bacterium]
MRQAILCCAVVAMIAMPVWAAPGDWWILPIDRTESGPFTTVPGIGYAGGDGLRHSGSASDISRIYWRLNHSVERSVGAVLPDEFQLFKIEWWDGTPTADAWQPLESRINGERDDIWPIDPEIPWVGNYGTNHQVLGASGLAGPGQWRLAGPGPRSPEMPYYNAGPGGIWMWLDKDSAVFAKWDFGWSIDRTWAELRVTQVTPEPATAMLLAMGGIAVFRRRRRAVLALAMACAAVLAAADRGMAADVVSTPFPGVGITRIHRALPVPRILNMEILVIDLTDPRIEWLVTPGDPTYRLDYTLARTTTYVREWGLDGAVNANLWSGGLGSEGDSRDAIGPAVSEGYVIHLPRFEPPYDPALAIWPDGTASAGCFMALTGMRQVVAGIGYDNGQLGTMLVENGINRGATAQPSAGSLNPRTVAGVTQDGRTLVLAAIDGRISLSAGMTLPEAADLLLEFGVWNGVNFDGGGSTTMVLRPPGGTPTIINLTTGWERPVVNHLGFRVIPEHDGADLIAAFAFGATDFTRPVHNWPAATYTKIRQVSGDTASLVYDADRGYGYTDLTGLDPVPSDDRDVLDGDGLYAEHIGVRGASGSIRFRVDVPGGFYRFVAAGADVSAYNHVTQIRVRDGGGTWVNLVDYEHVDRPTAWRVGFAGKTPPPVDGAGHDSGTFTDPKFQPLFTSGVIKVASGYLEFEQIGKGVNSSDRWGGDLCLLEVWRLDMPEPAMEVWPVAVDFPHTWKNHVTQTVPVTIASTGQKPLTYSASLVGEDMSQFELAGATTGILSPGADGVVTVRFTPHWIGSASAQVRITSDAPVNPLVIVSLSGFAVSDPPPDLDEDGDVDLADFSTFDACFNGPNRSPVYPSCIFPDFDGDADVDLADFGFFQACFNGPNRSPACN